MEKMKTLAIGDYLFEIVDDAARNDISELSGQKADKTAIPTKTSQLTNDSDFVKKSVTDSLEQQKANKQGLSLGVNSDGLVYLFIDGEPQGNGLDIKADAVAGDVVGYVDSNNDIILTGALANGSYTLKYEDEDGKQTEIGKITVGNSVVPYTNWIPKSTDTDGSIYNGKGYANKMRLNSSGVPTTHESYSITGFIPFTSGSVIRSSEGMFDATNTEGNMRVAYYDSEKVRVGEFKITPTNLSRFPSLVTVTDGALVFMGNLKDIHDSDHATRTAFVRICATHIDDDSIITIDEEIV